jgi:hypothetical protein
MNLDGLAMEAYHRLAPQGCPEPENLEAFAVLCGAAAAAACRYADDLDLGENLTPREWQIWVQYTHLLMRLADAHTWGRDGNLREVRSALQETVTALDDYLRNPQE